MVALKQKPSLIFPSNSGFIISMGLEQFLFQFTSNKNQPVSYIQRTKTMNIFSLSPHKSGKIYHLRFSHSSRSFLPPLLFQTISLQSASSKLTNKNCVVLWTYFLFRFCSQLFCIGVSASMMCVRICLSYCVSVYEIHPDRNSKNVWNEQQWMNSYAYQKFLHIIIIIHEWMDEWVIWCCGNHLCALEKITSQFIRKHWQCNTYARSFRCHLYFGNISRA